ERPLHYTGTDLVRYLKNLKAEDIVKIEILPNAGSEYDASITGGIIKIMLKNRRDDGADGSIGVSGNFVPEDKHASAFSPYYNMNYKINKLNLYAQLNYGIYRLAEHIDEETIHPSINMNEHSIYSNPQRTDIGSARIGGIYDLNDKQSVGLEVNYSDIVSKAKMLGKTTIITDGNQTDIASNYDPKVTIDNYSASANYLLKLDSSGSMFKVLLDYFHNNSDNTENYHSIYSGYLNIDSVYRSAIPTINNTYAATVDWSHHFNDINTLNFGAKYARNEMHNSTLFEYLQGADWNEISLFSSENSFTENISAIYGMFSSKIQKITYSLGLRGEYTLASPYTNKTDAIEKQHYFKLFPSINAMLPFSKNGKHSLVWNYHRTITRPSFMQLNPTRVATTEYSVIAGNPKLQPAIADDGSISLNLFYKYNLTAGVTNTQHAFGMVRIPDPEAPGVIIQTTDNVTKNTVWYLSLNGPVNPTKWWQMNINITGRRNFMDVLGEKLLNYNFFGYMNNTFSLPEDFKLDVSGFYQSPIIFGNIKSSMEVPQVNMTLRKQFIKNRLTATLFVNNVFDYKTLMKVNDADFTQVMHDKNTYGLRTIGASLSYYFQSGKKVSDKKVETGAAEEKARMN
ncbi:MAG: outer membrane beta-barrel family protein, partial [Candidatus Azobacteroides sp.]|nr:outer membrane beta-barrel family protein [Candidatus Azobacteroides sp.]